MQCPQCQHEHREGLKFCNQCGTPLSGRCTQCGFTNALGSKFCGECGISLTIHIYQEMYRAYLEAYAGLNRQAFGTLAAMQVTS